MINKFIIFFQTVLSKRLKVKIIIDCAGDGTFKYYFERIDEAQIKQLMK